MRHSGARFRRVISTTPICRTLDLQSPTVSPSIRSGARRETSGFSGTTGRCPVLDQDFELCVPHNLSFEKPEGTLNPHRFDANTIAPATYL